MMNSSRLRGRVAGSRKSPETQGSETTGEDIMKDGAENGVTCSRGEKEVLGPLKDKEDRLLKRDWKEARWWWHLPSIPALRKKKQVDFFEFKASLDYKSSKATEKPCFGKSKGGYLKG